MFFWRTRKNGVDHRRRAGKVWPPAIASGVAVNPTQYISRLRGLLGRLIRWRSKETLGSGETEKNLAARDLEPRDEVNGGRSIPLRGHQPLPRKTGEIDFMKDVE